MSDDELTSAETAPGMALSSTAAADAMAKSWSFIVIVLNDLMFVLIQNQNYDIKVHVK
jgi:hypothetical protein